MTTVPRWALLVFASGPFAVHDTWSVQVLWLAWLVAVFVADSRTRSRQRQETVR